MKHAKIKKSIILLHGFFPKSFFVTLKKCVKKGDEVFILEGRPSLKSSESLIKGLGAVGITPTVISDNMAGFLFFQGWVKEVWVSYQLSDQNGALCPVGALILGVLAKQHNVTLCAFKSDVKMKLFGQAKELLSFAGKRIAPAGVNAYTPLVEWLPKKYIKGIY